MGLTAKDESERYWYAFLDALDQARADDPELDVVAWAVAYKSENPR